MIAGPTEPVLRGREVGQNTKVGFNNMGVYKYKLLEIDCSANQRREY